MKGNNFLLAIYKRKEDAPTSYYYQDGEKELLPNRVCIKQYPFAEVYSGGRCKPKGQLKATFKKLESSPYRNENGTLHSNIYPVKSSATAIIGVGDIRGTDDLLVFEDRSEGTWQSIAIHIFPGGKFKVSEIINTWYK